MALIGQTLPSLLDVYSRTDKNGRIAKIVEQLAKSNDVITDAIYVPCNDGSKHKTTIRAGIPEPVWRRYNQGVQPTKTQTVPVTDTTGMALWTKTWPIAPVMRTRSACPRTWASCRALTTRFPATPSTAIPMLSRKRSWAWLRASTL